MEEKWEGQHEEFMGEALAEARKALALEEVPIGAVLVREGRIVGRGYNLRETQGDPTAHAEIIALREAARLLGTWRLADTTMYVTIEPCPMCAGALVLARAHLVRGPRSRGAGSNPLDRPGRAPEPHLYRDRGRAGGRMRPAAAGFFPPPAGVKSFPAFTTCR